MSKSRTRIPSGAWPRLMRQDLAAAYLDISTGKLKTDVSAGSLPSPSLLNPPRWDKEKLDEWLDDQTCDEPITGLDWLKKLDNAHKAQTR